MDKFQWMVLCLSGYAHVTLNPMKNLIDLILILQLKTVMIISQTEF